MRLPYNFTRFILHGGGGGIKCPQNDIFHSSMLIGDSPKILIVASSVAESEEAALYGRVVSRFTALNPSSQCELASRKGELLVKQAQNCDSLYFCGGSEVNYRAVFTKELLLDVIKGKVVGGSSAGANLFSRNFYSNDRSSIEAGFNILPFNTICHFSIDKAEKSMALSEAWPLVPVLELAEKHFVSILAKI